MSAKEAADSALPALLQTMRRAAGLSQGELARQARLTRPYISQLEKGSRRSPSRKVALSLASALHLDAAQRRAFLDAAGWPELEVPLHGNSSGLVQTDDAYALARQLLDACPFPAVLHDSRWLVGYVNRGGHAFFEALQAPLAPQGEAVSLLESVFHPVIRAHLSDWEAWARAMLAQFKRDSLHLGQTPAHLALLGRLRLLPDFARLWHSVEPSADTVPTMRLPLKLLGTRPCLVEVLRFQVVGLPELWMVAFLPRDAVAEEFMRSLLR